MQKFFVHHLSCMNVRGGRYSSLSSLFSNSSLRLFHVSSPIDESEKGIGKGIRTASRLNRIKDKKNSISAPIAPVSTDPISTNKGDEEIPFEKMNYVQASYYVSKYVRTNFR